MTNPNCEYGANFVAVHTLAQWSKCQSSAVNEEVISDPDAKLERDNEAEIEEEGEKSLSAPNPLPEGVYR